MTPLLWVSFAGTLVSLIVGCTAIYNFSLARRQAAMAEGKRMQEQDQIRRDLDRAYEKIRVLETGGQTTALELVEIKTTLKYIRESIERMESKLNHHCDGGE
jgi:hypothetical protein